MAGNEPVIIIKRVKKGGHDAHHGGAWKVAYADFVTAMMAFFLLLWLLNATTEEQKRGIADYFSPASVSKSTSGAGGLLGGLAISADGARMSEQPRGITLALPPLTPASEDSEAVDEAPPSDEAAVTDEELERRRAEREDTQFGKAEQELRQAIEEVDGLKKFADSLVIDRTPEGLRIQIVDQEGVSMFPNGSDEMYSHTRDLLSLVAKVVIDQPNQIAVYGHTDSVPYAADHGYGNWELSSDRANASRRALIEAGLPPERIAHVVGKADTDPLIADDPANPSNRRISIIILSDTSLYGDPAAAAE